MGHFTSQPPAVSTALHPTHLVVQLPQPHYHDYPMACVVRHQVSNAITLRILAGQDAILCVYKTQPIHKREREGEGDI